MTTTTKKAAPRKAAVKRTVELMELESRSTFTKNGREVELKSPEGFASEAQVMVLYKRGLLAIVKPGQVAAFTKGEASFALDASQSA